MGHVLDDTVGEIQISGGSLNRPRNLRVHGLDEKDFILVVHGHNDEELSFTTHKIRSKGVAGGHKVVWITGGSGVPHLGHLFDILFALGNDIGRNDDIKDEVALYEGDLADRSASHHLFAHDVITILDVVVVHVGAGWIVGLLIGHGRCILIGIVANEVGLRAAAALVRLNGFSIPVCSSVVVVLGRIVGGVLLLRALGFVILVISHGHKE